jgi:hypothetical protein
MTRRQAAPRRRSSKGRSKPRSRSTARSAAAPRPVTAAELRALGREIERRLAPRGPSAGARGRSGSAGGGRVSKVARKRTRAEARWNPDPEDVQRSVAQLVLTVVEFLRQLMERQAIRRIEQKTLTRKEAEAVGLALMKLEETVLEIGNRFGLTAEDLNLDLGPLKLI